MNKGEICKKLIEKGWYYDKLTGEVKNSEGLKSMYLDKKGYYRILLYDNKKKYEVYAHRFVYFFVHRHLPEYIDHINRIRTDNTIDNLRETTHLKNQNNKFGKGYCYHKKNKKYMAQCQVDGKRKFLGYYDTEDEASKAYFDYKNQEIQSILN